MLSGIAFQESFEPKFGLHSYIIGGPSSFCDNIGCYFAQTLILGFVLKQPLYGPLFRVSFPRTSHNSLLTSSQVAARGSFLIILRPASPTKAWHQLRFFSQVCILWHSNLASNPSNHDSMVSSSGLNCSNFSIPSRQSHRCHQCYVPPRVFAGNPSSLSFTRPDRGLGTI